MSISLAVLNEYIEIASGSSQTYDIESILIGAIS